MFEYFEHTEKISSKSFTHVITVAKHQAETEQFIVLQDVQDQVYEVAINII